MGYQNKEQSILSHLIPIVILSNPKYKQNFRIWEVEGTLEVTNPQQKEGITPLHPAFPENTMVVVKAV